jgi:hypothetical protein
MKKILTSLILLALCIIFASPAYSDTLIIPGERIDGVYIGMRSEDVVRTLGKPDKAPVNTAAGLQEHQYIKNHLLMIDIDPRTSLVKNIATGHTPRYQTNTGIQVGSTLEYVQLRMGKGEITQMSADSISLKYVSAGIEFVLRDKDKTKKVFVIIVKEKH